MREMAAAMNNSGCWRLTVAMDSKMKIAFDGVGNGQWRGGGQTMVQFLAVDRDRVMDNGNSSKPGQRQWRWQWTTKRTLDDGSGQWAFKAITARQLDGWR
jgi:hypothetical protein